jgi:hypothetical protein
MRKLACLALLALAPACGSSSPPTPPDAASEPDLAPPDTRVVQPCDHAPALCAKLAACAPFLLAAGYGDLAGCNARVTQICTEQNKSDGSGMSEPNLAACEAALATASCADVYANRVAACVFHGDYADGATCGDNSQCESGFCDHGGGLCGVCAPKSAAGGPCGAAGNDQCQTGLVCSSGSVCVAPASVGGACDDATAPCLPGSFCTTAKTCALTVAAGQECPGAYLNLADGTVCFGKSTAASPQLATQLGAVGPGEPCGLAPGTGLSPTLCAPGGVPACTLTSGAITLFGLPTKGQCAKLFDDGHTCTAGTECMTGAQCIAGTCQIPSGRQCWGVDAGTP